MVEMWSNFQSIRFLNEHVRILGKTGKLRTRMCAGGSELCTAAYSFHGLKGGTREGRFFVANDTYAEGSSFGAASWTLAMHTGEKTFWRATVEVWTLMILGHFPVSPDQQCVVHALTRVMSSPEMPDWAGLRLLGWR